MYNLIEYCDSYSAIIWQYWLDKSDLDNDSNIVSFPANSISFKSKVIITRKNPADANTKDIEIAVPLKYWSNFSRTLEMLLINCKLYLILTWSSSFVITNSAGAGTFAITDTKPYVVTLSTQDNIKLLNQLKLGLKITVNWNKYHQKGQ